MNLEKLNFNGHVLTVFVDTGGRKHLFGLEVAKLIKRESFNLYRTLKRKNVSMCKATREQAIYISENKEGSMSGTITLVNKSEVLKWVVENFGGDGIRPFFVPEPKLRGSRSQRPRKRQKNANGDGNSNEDGQAFTSSAKGDGMSSVISDITMSEHVDMAGDEDGGVGGGIDDGYDTTSMMVTLGSKMKKREDADADVGREGNDTPHVLLPVHRPAAQFELPPTSRVFSLRAKSRKTMNPEKSIGQDHRRKHPPVRRVYEIIPSNPPSNGTARPNMTLDRRYHADCSAPDVIISSESDVSSIESDIDDQGGEVGRDREQELEIGPAPGDHDHANMTVKLECGKCGSQDVRSIREFHY